MTETKTKLVYDVNSDTEKIPVIIVAAGSSSRMGKDKLLMEISGIPVIARTLMNFQRCDCISDIILVTREEKILPFQSICEKYQIDKITDIVEGGNTRQESVLKGLHLLDKKADKVLIHDGARPLTEEWVVSGVAKALESYSAAACGVKPKDTIKEISSDKKVIKTVNRDNLIAVQTPQGVRVKDYLDALSKAGDLSHFTDDMSIMESAGFEVFITEGDYKNIKITTPEDIAAAESFILGNEE